MASVRVVLLTIRSAARRAGLLPATVGAIALVLLPACNSDEAAGPDTRSSSSSSSATAALAGANSTVVPGPGPTVTVPGASSTSAAPVTTTRPTGRGAPLPSDPPPSGVSQGSGRRQAIDLRAEPRCDPQARSVGLADLFWSPVSGGAEQRVAVTTRKTGFDTGSYAVTDSLAPGTVTYTFRELQPGAEYYWRILTRDGDEWIASLTAGFTGPMCIEDKG